MKQYKHVLGLSALLTIAITNYANAAVIQTSGAGSAVTTVSATANFESQNALFDNPYIENQLSFTHTNLSNNNNSCGFAGCYDNIGFGAFTGNYLYGVGGVDGFFTISTINGNVFSGLEFFVGTGFGLSTVSNISWTALLNGTIVGSGSLDLAVGSVIGFSDAAGFDTLTYTEIIGSLSAPALDGVRAQYTGVTQTPLPAAAWLFASALPLVGFGRRNKV